MGYQSKWKLYCQFYCSVMYIFVVEMYSEVLRVFTNTDIEQIHLTAKQQLSWTQNTLCTQH